MQIDLRGLAFPVNIFPRERNNRVRVMPKGGQGKGRDRVTIYRVSKKYWTG